MTNTPVKFKIISSETEGTFVFESEGAYGDALDWYNSKSKADIIEFCAKHGLDLVNRDGRMIVDWADAAMELFARHGVPPRT